MKNINVLPTDKPSRLYYHPELKELVLTNKTILREVVTNQNIYITNSEEVREGDLYLDIDINKVCKNINPNEVSFNIQKKIILTTDQDLIKDGIQAISDEFLEWFVKNPSCEEVEVVFNNRGITGTEKILKTFGEYKIVIPKEESNNGLEIGQIPPEEGVKINPILIDEMGTFSFNTKSDRIHWKDMVAVSKQETLEEVLLFPLIIENGMDYLNFTTKIFNKGAKWQQERSYSEEDMKSAFKVGFSIGYGSDVHAIDEKNKTCEEWFEQFKKK